MTHSVKNKVKVVANSSSLNKYLNSQNNKSNFTNKNISNVEQHVVS